MSSGTRTTVRVIIGTVQPPVTSCNTPMPKGPVLAIR